MENESSFMFPTRHPCIQRLFVLLVTNHVPHTCADVKTDYWTSYTFFVSNSVETQNGSKIKQLLSSFLDLDSL